MTPYDWYTLKSIYSVDECSEILKICENNKSSTFADSPAPGKKANTYVVETHKFDNTLDRFFALVNEANNNYFGYDLFNERPLGINVNIYENDLNEYPYHRDCNIPGTMCDSKITAILNISPEPYKGGEFSMFFGEDRKVDEVDNIGSLLLFPSFLFHKVSPVISGKRITLSTWLQGPNFK